MFRLFLVFVLTAAAQTLFGQIPALEGSGRTFTFSATSDLVLLDVSVKDAAGEHVPNLTKANFQVLEDGKPQIVTHFASDDVPVTVGLVIDTSGSMRSRYAHLATAAMSFVRASNPNDEVFVVNFGDRVSYGLPASVPFSGSIPQLRAALALGTPAGRTALYDGVISSLGHLEAGKRDKKTLVVISDGGDNSSVNGSEELMLAVRESRATIYTIGIFDEGDPDQNPALLRRLARISGGSAYFPQSIDDVTGVCREIARDIRLRYTIGYVPIPSAARSSLRKIDVVAKGPNGHKLVSLTRRSYSLPDSDQQRGAARKPGS